MDLDQAEGILFANWDYVEIVRSFKYDMGRIGNNVYSAEEIEHFSSTRGICRKGEKVISTGNLYLLRQLVDQKDRWGEPPAKDG